MSTAGWILSAAALVLLTLGLVGYGLGGPGGDRRTAAIVSLILGADLLVLALGGALV